MDARTVKLNRLFKQVVDGQTPVSRQNARLFLESICLQPDPTSCADQMIAGRDGLASLQTAMFMDVSPSFLNGLGAQIIAYLMAPKLKDVANGSYLQRIITQITTPAILWRPLIESFKEHKLQDNAQHAFAWLLINLVTLPAEDGAPYRELARDPVISQGLLTSSHPETRALGTKIKHIVDTYGAGAPKDFEDGPGGRHDNDLVDFRSIKILPTADEITAKDIPFLRTAAEVDAVDVDNRRNAHLDNQFRLYREDMLSELREELQIVLGQKKGKHRGLVFDGLKYVGLYSPDDSKKLQKWGVVLKCKDGSDLWVFKKVVANVEKRKELLIKDRGTLRDQSLVCLVIDGIVVAFAKLRRDESYLARMPPHLVLQLEGEQETIGALCAFSTAKNIKVVQIDTAVFSYEPVLERLQKINQMPLWREILAWEPDTVLAPPADSPDKIITALQATRSKDLQHIINSPKPIRLDGPQTNALLSGLTRRVSLIQGPPGTGKSFVGALLAKIFHDNTSQTILVCCYTNHALDQFLEDLLDIGIPSLSLVRLGGKSTTKTEPLSLFNARQRAKFTRSDWTEIENMRSDAAGCFARLEAAYRKSSQNVSFTDILTHIEFEDDAYFEAFRVPAWALGGNDGMQIVGAKGRAADETYLIRRWTAGNNPGSFVNEIHVKAAKAIWMLSREKRREKVLQWENTVRKEHIEELCRRGSDYNDVQRSMDFKYSQGDSAVLQQKRIIGCTTTAAAKYSDSLLAAKPDILLVEEAGEILESHVLTALGRSTERLILIGDHQQLRPKVDSYRLTVEKGDGFDLNRSMFERLVLRGYPHETLSKQHRMRPEISKLIRHLTYPDLVDADSTKIRPDVLGLRDNIVFFSHNHREDENPRISTNSGEEGAKTSKQNTFEAQMVLKIVRYLGQQGYGTDQLVILTPYLGQLHCLREALSKTNDPILSDIDSADLVRAGVMSTGAAQLAKRGPIRLATIDNYQGEESDIVIISMTRSNPDHDIGFLYSPERVNVLLSRARNGLIMIGDANTFSNARRREGKELWTRLFTLLREDGHVYDGIPIKCQRHPDHTALLSSPEDFDRETPDGGCTMPCGVKLRCQLHTCPLKCHRVTDHSNMKCEKLLDDRCSNGHKRTWHCFQSPPLNCAKCDKAAKEAEKKQKAEFERQMKREAEEREHALKIAELDEEIAKAMQETVDRELAKQRADALSQKQKDLENAKARAKKRAEDATSSPAVASKSDSKSMSSSGILQASLKMTAEPKVSTSDPPGSAAALRSSVSEAKWAHQKAMEGADNEHIDRIMEMTGLENVKAQVLRIKDKIDLTKRQGASAKDERFNISLLGNPGTGKTTVARHYAKFLTSVDILPGDTFVETTGSRLANDGVPGIKKTLEQVLATGGGAIFIDEAYQLTGTSNFGGGQVLDFLLAEMENNVGKLVFILAGYNKQMEKFFEHNPGIPSRVPYRLQFDDYTDDELRLMFERLIEKKHPGRMKVEGGIRGLYVRIAVRRLGRGRGRDGFGNARALHNLLATITERQAARVSAQRSQGILSDDFLLKMEDIIGPDPAKAVPGSEAWKKLQKLIGLNAVKASIQNLFDIMTDNYRRELREKEPVQVSLNRVFLGNPGTGKTTVAKLYGEVLADLGMLTNGEVVVKNPADFVGSVLGQSESNTKGILASTVGKVLVIDEVYMLYGGVSGDGNKNDPFKTAVIDTIVAEVQSVPGDDRCVLLLGYEPQVREMFRNVNSGLSRRFAIEDAFRFEDFSEDELMALLDLKLEQQDLDASPDAKVVAIDMLSRARIRPNFGNGGEVDNMLGKAKNNYSSRVAKLPITQRPDDIIFQPVDFDPKFDRSAHSERNLQELFADVVGCEKVVDKLREYQNIARVMKQLGKSVKDVRQHIPTNFVFKGPPGTGKTTTARKMGQVYYDMGFLSSIDVIECSASDLVAGYVGQTGEKTRQQFDKALGKVLFVDEAYRLSEGPFAKEAMDEIVGLLTQEAYAGKLIVILAGYDQEINKLLQTNTGLSSRFPDEIIFENLDPQNCLDILKNELSKEDIHCSALTQSSPAYQELVDMVNSLSSLPSWGNARDMKTLAKQMIRVVFNKVTATTNSMALQDQEAVDVMATMLHERSSRSLSLPVGKPSKASGLPLPTRTLAPPVISASHAVDTAPPPPPIASKEDAAAADSSDSDLRDLNVSDAVWVQLQADKQAAKRAEQRRQEEFAAAAKAAEDGYRAQAAAKALAAALLARLRQQAKSEELKRQLEAERQREQKAREDYMRRQRQLEELRRKEVEERKREAQVQQKLRSMGVCIAGFQWIKGAGGYRCAGGSHFITDGQLGL